MKTEILRMENLTVRGRSRRTARNISLCVRSGECCVVTGLNNAAVKELGEVFLGYGDVIAGRILLNGRASNVYTRQAMERQHAFYLDSRPVLLDSLSVGENLFLLKTTSLRKWHINYNAIHLQADALLQRYGLHFSSRMSTASLTLSEQLLITVMWAVNQGARLLVLHEVALQSTENEHRRLLGLLRKLKEEGLALLVLTSQPTPYYPLADSIIVMRDGKIQKKLLDPSQYPLSYSLMCPDLKSGTAANTGVSAYGEESIRLEGIHTRLGAAFDLPLHDGETALITTLDSAEQEALWYSLTFQARENPRIFADGTPLPCKGMQDLIRHRIVTWESGAQSDTLFSNLTADENVLLPSLKRISNGVGFYQHNAGYVLHDTNFFKVLPSELPMDLCDRSSTIRLLCERWRLYNPRVMMMWNILSNADIMNVNILGDFIRALNRRGTAVLLLEVDAKSCIPLCHTVVRIGADGTISRGKPAEIFPLPHHDGRGNHEE